MSFEKILADLMEIKRDIEKYLDAQIVRQEQRFNPRLSSIARPQVQETALIMNGNEVIQDLLRLLSLIEETIYTIKISLPEEVRLENVKLADMNESSQDLISKLEGIKEEIKEVLVGDRENGVPGLMDMKRKTSETVFNTDHTEEIRKLLIATGIVLSNPEVLSKKESRILLSSMLNPEYVRTIFQIQEANNMPPKIETIEKIPDIYASIRASQMRSEAQPEPSEIITRPR